MGLSEKNRGSLEKFILLVIFVAALIFVGSTYMKERTVTKERTLYYQLEMMRQGINTFQLIQKRLPSNLIELASSVYKLPGSELKNRYVEIVKVDGDGKVVDPFGNPYDYDPKVGWVKCASSKYVNW